MSRTLEDFVEYYRANMLHFTIPERREIAALIDQFRATKPKIEFEWFGDRKDEDGDRLELEIEEEFVIVYRHLRRGRHIGTSKKYYYLNDDSYYQVKGDDIVAKLKSLATTSSSAENAARTALAVTERLDLERATLDYTTRSDALKSFRFDYMGGLVKIRWPQK